MASIQDIHALEERIYDAVQEYLDNPDGYENATLHVYLDKDDMVYRAEMEDNLQGTEDDGIYPVADLIRDGEPDNDKASDIATNYESKQKFGNSNPCRWWLWSACGICRVLPFRKKT